MNLLEETKKRLSSLNKSGKDVVWVGSEDGNYAITWEEFVKIADLEYDAGFGGQEIAKDLVIVGVDWWMSRWEYDGSEGWEFNTLPTAATPNTKSFTVLQSEESWSTVKEMNSPGGKYGEDR